MLEDTPTCGAATITELTADIISKKLNVKKNMCDALVCSGRKYLRGPRGTGLIFIKDSIQKKITPRDK